MSLSYSHLVAGVTSLRDVRLLVQPATIIRGGTAALICSRDMQNAPLYTVKWYRGNHEFYRYTPMEDPDTRVFTIPGIYVDVSTDSLFRTLSVIRLHVGMKIKVINDDYTEVTILFIGSLLSLTYSFF